MMSNTLDKYPFVASDWSISGEDGSTIKKDIFACAVAEEMQKVYRNELGPQPVPLTVPGELISEEDMYFLDADNETDDDSNLDNMDQNEDNVSERRLKMKMVTRVELNKRARQKEQLKKEVEAKKLKGISKEIDWDLKLENTLLDGSPGPRLKIYDFCYSKVKPPRSLN